MFKITIRTILLLLRTNGFCVGFVSKSILLQKVADAVNILNKKIKLKTYLRNFYILIMSYVKLNQLTT